MIKKEAKDRIEKLKKEIRHHRYLYHVLNKQDISDAALDSLKNELFQLEQQYPVFVTADSPTQRVAGEPSEKFVKVKHEKRMLSLNDAFNEEDVQHWIDRLVRLDPEAKFDFFVETKIDGLAISLMYQDSVLVQAATRGNGKVGEDVTINIKTIHSVPLRLREHKLLKKQKYVEIRGEVYLPKKEFHRINAERKKRGEPTYMNPRNTAAGTLRQLDPALVAERKLQFFSYALPTDLGQHTHEEEHLLLQEFGFVTDPDARACTDLQAVFSFYKTIQKKRDSLDYDIDGIVVTVNDNALFDRFGVVGKAPRAAVALKFPAEQSTTIVEDIQIQIGRTGALTPVAHLKPVQIAGTTVARATLHNMDEIQRLGVKIGDTVIIEKAGDIIPDIVAVLPTLRTGKEKVFRMPKKCPVCHQPVLKKSGEVVTYCINEHCLARQREQFYHFVSKKGLDIDGLGPKSIDQLLDADLIVTPADLFSLTVEDLESLEGFADVSAKKLVEGIDAARKVDLSRLIFALGIRQVGEQTAIDLAEHFGSMEALRKASRKEIESLHAIGASVADSVLNYFADEARSEFLERLIHELHIQAPQKKTSTVFLGESYVFTGTLQSMTRDDARALVRANGGIVSSTVSRNLDFLVVGDKPGSKVAKAQKLGVTILSEEDFLKKLQ